MHAAMLFVTPDIFIGDHELHFTAVRASGPGGQHVNATNSAVQLKFDAANCPALRPDVLARLKSVAGSRMNSDGVITLAASGDRSQHRNRAEARARLVALIRTAATPPRPRKKTRPSRATIERRLKTKAHRSGVKKTRSRVTGED